MKGILSADDYLSGIAIRSVELLRPNSGDVVVLTVESRLAPEQIHNLGMHMKVLMPPGVRVGVLHDGMKLEIVRPADLETERKVNFREFT